jgi:hypothetical protein
MDNGERRKITTITQKGRDQHHPAKNPAWQRGNWISDTRVAQLALSTSVYNNRKQCRHLLK